MINRTSARVHGCLALVWAVSAFLGCGARSDVLDLAVAGGSGTAGNATGGAGGAGGSAVTTTTTTATITTTSSAGSGGAGGGGGAGGSAQCWPVGAPCAGPGHCCSGECTQGLCGAPSQACKPGQPPFLLATTQPGPMAIAVDSDFVYFATSDATPGVCGPNSIVRISKLGGMAQTLWKPVRPVFAIAVDDERVYWNDDPVNLCTQPADSGYVLVAGPKNGGPSTMFSPAGQYVPAADIATDPSHVYWVFPQDGIVSILFAAKAGGEPASLIDLNFGPVGAAVDDVNLYTTGLSGVLGIPKSSPGDFSLVDPTFDSTFRGIAHDPGNIYFAEWQPCQGADCSIFSQIGAVPKDQPGAVLWLAARADKEPQRLAVDSTHVYWTEHDVSGIPPSPAGAVIRAAKDGSSIEEVVTAKAPTGIALDSVCVYWVDEADGTVWRAPK
jgi:hypothetical protein